MPHGYNWIDCEVSLIHECLVTLFLICRYESEFFLNVVNCNGIVSWAAVDSSRPDSQSDELIGFVTTRIVIAKDSEVGARLYCKWQFTFKFLQT